MSFLGISPKAQGISRAEGDTKLRNTLRKRNSNLLLLGRDLAAGAKPIDTSPGLYYYGLRRVGWQAGDIVTAT